VKKEGMMKARRILGAAMAIAGLALAGYVRSADGADAGAVDDSGQSAEPKPVAKPKPVWSKGPSGQAWTDCPAESIRGPLNLRRAVWNQRGVPVVKKTWRPDVRFRKPVGPFEEAKRIIYASDSYPRRPGKLVGKPRVEMNAAGVWDIHFELDRFDDVMVRVVDKEGKSVRSIGCGVLGANAPAPFAKDSLKQVVTWDGKDSAGRPAAAGCRIEVGVGLEPTFAGFVGYRKTQLTPYLNALDVDNKGRVYVGLHTNPERNDPVMLRFNRDGEYVDMLYPSNPAALDAMGKKLDDVYPLVEHIDGKAVPIWGPIWRARLFRWDMYIKLPFVVDRENDRGYFVESRCPFSHRPDRKAYFGANTYSVDDLDHFWFEPPYASGVEGSFFMVHNLGPTAIDGQGMVYLSLKRAGVSHGYTRAADPNACATIVKIDPKTGARVPAFSYLGTKKLSKPRYYLGRPGDFRRLGKEQKDFDKLHYEFYTGKIKEVPEWMAGSEAEFTCIQDIAFDEKGNILVMDGVPSRIKMYTAEGQYKGTITGLTFDGKARTFFDGISIKHGNGASYVLASFQDDPKSAYLLKCTGLLTDPKVVWHQKLDERSRFIAIDGKASPTLVWVGNGGGPATLTRITDTGDALGETKHFGGLQKETLVEPWTVAAAEDGTVFVHDRGRHRIVACKDDGSQWRATDAERPNPWFEFCNLRRQFIPSAADNAHHNSMEASSMVVDPVNRRLLVTYSAGAAAAPGGGYGQGGRLLGIPKNPSRNHEAFDFDLKRLKLKDGPVPGWNDIYWCAVDKDGGPYEMALSSGRFNEAEKRTHVGTLALRNSDGTFKNKSVVKLYLGTGSMSRDSRGGLYVSDLENVTSHWFGEITFSFPNWGGYEAGEESTLRTTCWFRGDHPITHLPEVSYLVKFGPKGGVRGTDDELWAHRGAGGVANVCACKGVVNLLATDGEDRILAGVPDHYATRIIDSAGNLIQRFGCYGNAETVPPVGASAKGLGFREINSVAAAGDTTYIVDKALRRVAKIKMAYRHRVSIPLEDAAR
jgi:hypothetical protein